MIEDQHIKDERIEDERIEDERIEGLDTAEAERTGPADSPESPDSPDSGTDPVPTAMDFDVVDSAAFEPLDVKVIRVWQLENLLVFGGICVATFVVGSFMWFLSPVPKPVLVLTWALSIGLMTVATCWWPKRYFSGWSYCLQPQTLELRFGIYWQASVLIPLSRVQHVDMHRNPLERRYGLATLAVHTAGTRDASHRLPGLEHEVARRLRDQLATSANLRPS